MATRFCRSYAAKKLTPDISTGMVEAGDKNQFYSVHSTDAEHEVSSWSPSPPPCRETAERGDPATRRRTSSVEARRLTVSLRRAQLDGHSCGLRDSPF